MDVPVFVEVCPFGCFGWPGLVRHGGSIFCRRSGEGVPVCVSAFSGVWCCWGYILFTCSSRLLFLLPHRVLPQILHRRVPPLTFRHLCLLIRSTVTVVFRREVRSDDVGVRVIDLLLETLW